jgi:hypothetical protein
MYTQGTGHELSTPITADEANGLVQKLVKAREQLRELDYEAEHHGKLIGESEGRLEEILQLRNELAAAQQHVKAMQERVSGEAVLLRQQNEQLKLDNNAIVEAAVRVVESCFSHTSAACPFCNQIYSINNETIGNFKPVSEEIRNAMRTHVMSCESHPLRQENERLFEECHKLRAELERRKSHFESGLASLQGTCFVDDVEPLEEG